MEFKSIIIPGLGTKYIPQDIVINIPKDSGVSEDKIHFLAEMPWDDKYLENIPNDFLGLFKTILPDLHVRSTDVHTAVSLSYMDDLLKEFEDMNIDREVVGIALTLHDIGWGKMTPTEIAASLGVSGLKLNIDSVGPKEKHAVIGEKMAGEILEKYYPNISSSKKELILKSILYHDRPEEVLGLGKDLPLEIKLLVDLDHLWSFNYLDFWLDTIRKGVNPLDYVNNLRADIEDYFTTDNGRRIARRLLEERHKEYLLIKRMRKQ
jgi:hypothetical protein